MRPPYSIFARHFGGRLALPSSRLARETGWLIVAKLVQGLCSFLATLAVARHLGPGAFGELSLAIATASLVGAIAALGLEHIASRELSGAGDSKLDGRVLPALRALRGIGAAAGAGVLLAMAFSPPASSHGISGLLLVMCLLPIAQVGDISEWQLIAGGRSKWVAFTAIAVSPLAAALRLLLVLMDGNLLGFAWVFVAEWGLRSLLLSLASNRLAVQSQPDHAQLARTAVALLRESAPLLLAGIAVFIYMRIDQFMIAAMLDTRQVGLYSAIVVVSEAPLVLPALLLRASLPILTRQAADAPDAAAESFVRLLRGCFYLHVAGAAILAIFAEPIVTLMYGEPYREASTAFRLLVLGAPFVALGVLSSAWLVIHRCTGHALRRTILGVVVNIALNLVLIPRFGIAGAALATLVAQIAATYLADAAYRETRGLFKLKTRAIWPGKSGIA